MNKRIEIIVYSIIVLVLSLLCVGIVINGLKLHCSNCQINFKASRTDYKEAYNKDQQAFSINMSELVEYYKLNHCLIKKDEFFLLDYGTSKDF